MPESAVITSLDVRGLLCPEPLIKLGEAMRSLRSGDRLEVLADDPVAPLDFAAFCHRTGHPMRESTKESSWFRFVIEHR